MRNIRNNKRNGERYEIFPFLPTDNKGLGTQTHSFNRQCTVNVLNSQAISDSSLSLLFAEKSISRLQTEITHGNLSASESPKRNKVTIAEDNLSDREVICVAPGYSLCYYREVMLKNKTRVCSSLRHKSVPKLEGCFHWPSCKSADVCLKIGDGGLIISRPAFYICLILTTVIINIIIWASLRKCGGKDPIRSYPSTSDTGRL